MAIQWMDDFTSYGTDASRVSRMADGPYAQLGNVDLVVDPDPNAPGERVLFVQGNSDSVVRKVLSAAQTTVGVAARYWISVLPDSTLRRPIFADLTDTNNNQHVWVTVNPSGILEAYRHDATGDVLIGQSTSPVVITDAWRHVECKFVLDATAGSIQVRIEGNTGLSITGVRTTSNVSGVAASAQNVRIRNYVGGVTTGAPNLYVKDLIIWDGTSSINNNFMGTCQVYKIIPDGDVSLGWSPSTGTTGFDLINETTPDDDTKYIVAASSGLTSEFTLTNLPVNTTVVKGVMAFNRSKKVDGGDGNLQVSLVSGASTGDGANRAITTAYTYWYDIFDQDPSGSNWSKSLVDALHMKINRTV